MVEELLLGDNPFIGVSHLSQEKARDEVKEASLENKIRVIESAIDGGATGFAFTAQESNFELLTYLSTTRVDLLESMNYYILVPYGRFYVEKANVVGTPALIKSTIHKMFRRRSAVLDALVGSFSLQAERLAGLFIEAEVAPYLRILPKERVKAVLLHEIITFRLLDLLRQLDSYVREKIGTGFGLETRNQGHFWDWIRADSYRPEYIMSPINPLGYQMAPSRDLVESSMRQLSEYTRIIAMNILASGATDLHQAVDYISKYRDDIYAITSASIKPHRTLENFRELARTFL